MRTGPRHDRSESAKLPDGRVILEGIVVDTIAAKTVNDGAQTITPGKGEIEIISWVYDDASEKWRLYRSGRTATIYNFDESDIVEGTYVRCEFHVAWWQPYWQSCADWGLSDLADGEFYEIEEPA
jgi:hypothetical protein